MARKENASYEKSGNRTAKLTAEDVGALPLTGGTLTGELCVKHAITIDENYSNARLVSYGAEEGGDHYTDVESKGKETGTIIKLRIRSEKDGKNLALKDVLKLATNIDGGSSAFYNLYGEHNYENIKLGSTINMYDGKNLRGEVIQCLDDGDENNYGSELLIGACGNTYIGAGESHTNLYKENGASSGETMYITSDNSIYLYVNCNTMANRKIAILTKDAFYPATNGAFTLGTSSLRWGQIYSTASSISTSDRNEKHDINPVDTEMVENLIMGLQPVTYKFNDGSSDRTHYGLIAQDVEELLEELNISSQNFAAFIKSQKEVFDEKSGEMNLVYDEDGNPEYTYGLRYEEFIAPLIKMVQAQQKKIETLEERMEKLERLLGGGSDGVADTENGLEMD